MKICRIHGKLKEDEIRTYTRNRRGRSEIAQGCKLCHRATASRARNADRTKANAWNRQNRKENPERERGYRKTTIEKLGIENWRRREVLRQRGLTIEQHDLMIKQQNNLCAICHLSEKRKGRTGDITPLAIDHCHITDKVRGLLCHSCNVALGSFRDSIELLQNAIEYLKKHE